MSEIEVGEYIRTIDGYIGKLKRIEFDDIDKSLKWYYVDKKEPDTNIIKEVCTNKPYITKHSKNIIDLIEVGDYVNGYKVDDIENKKLVIGNTTQVVEQILENNEDIKTIVTKEQFNSVMYKVVE